METASFEHGDGQGTVTYQRFGRNYVFTQTKPEQVLCTIMFVEDVIAAIKAKEAPFLESGAKFYNLVPSPTKHTDPGDHNNFEFCQVVNDPHRKNGCPLDWLHTHCPTQVTEVFKQYLPEQPYQTFHAVASGKPGQIQNWSQ